MDNNQTPGNTEEVVDDPIEKETVEPDPEPEKEVKEQVLAFESSTGADFKYTLTDADEFKLKIDTFGDTWIGVQNEKKEELTPVARVMKNGETLELDVSAVEYIRIRVAVPAYANIYVNGEKLEYESDV